MLFCNNSFCEGTVRSKSVLTLLRVTEEVAAKLMESAYHQIERDGILATRLCTHKDDVELTNENKLQQLPGLNSSLCLFGVFFSRCCLTRIQVKIGKTIICGMSHVFFQPQLDATCFLTPVISCSGTLLICNL